MVQKQSMFIAPVSNGGGGVINIRPHNLSVPIQKNLAPTVDYLKAGKFLSDQIRSEKERRRLRDVEQNIANALKENGATLVEQSRAFADPNQAAASFSANQNLMKRNDLAHERNLEINDKNHRNAIQRDAASHELNVIEKQRQENRTEVKRARAVKYLQDMGAPDDVVARAAAGNFDAAMASANTERRDIASDERKFNYKKMEQASASSIRLEEHKLKFDIDEANKKIAHINELARNRFANLDDESLKELGVPKSLWDRARQDPRIAEDFAKAKLASLKSYQQRAGKNAADLEHEKQIRRRDGKVLMFAFEDIQEQVESHTREQLESGIGAIGSNDYWQAFKGWATKGSRAHQLRTALHSVLGDLRSSLMGTIKGQASDRDVQIAIQKIDAAFKAETAESFFNALSLAQRSMSRGFFLSSEEYKALNNPFLGQDKKISALNKIRARQNAPHTSQVREDERVAP